MADKISETYLSETFVLQMGADFMNIKRKCHLKMERLGFDLNNAPFLKQEGNFKMSAVRKCDDYQMMKLFIIHSLTKKYILYLFYL